jgi:hypothetical protein
MRRFFVAVLLATLPIAAAAATLAPSAILANPSAYDGQTVTVAGTVSGVESKSTAMGAFTTYQLCDAKCISVIDKTKVSHERQRGNGDGNVPRIVQGTAQDVARHAYNRHLVTFSQENPWDSRRIARRLSFFATPA